MQIWPTIDDGIPPAVLRYVVYEKKMKSLHIHNTVPLLKPYPRLYFYLLSDAPPPEVVLNPNHTYAS